jgi:hypothetical protein
LDRRFNVVTNQQFWQKQLEVLDLLQAAHKKFVLTAIHLSHCCLLRKLGAGQDLSFKNVHEFDK